MASRILHLLPERRTAASVTLTLFLLSFFFVVFTRVSNPLASFRDLGSNRSPSNPIPIPIPSPIPNPTPDVTTISYPTRGDNLKAQRDPNPNPSPNPSSVQDDNLKVQKDANSGSDDGDGSVEKFEIQWEKCAKAQGVDYIPCLDNLKAIKALQSRRHMEHRERHCPRPSLRCLVPLPVGYKTRVPWPKSRDMVSLMVR